jgi:UDP-N-acetylglucosamine transferase subunit ALG13
MGDLPLIFATVGTDVHPFHRMTHWIDGWLEQGGLTRAQCFMQTGTSEEPKLALHYPYLGYTEMEQKVREAAAVVCHGGPGTIMLASTLGKRPIVVPRRKQFGEHVDDHQLAFTQRIARDGAILRPSPTPSCARASTARSAWPARPPSCRPPAPAPARRWRRSSS